MTTKATTDDDVIQEFHKVVNLSATELDHWLKTDESRSVGQHKDGSNEATGHISGRAVVEILRHRGTSYSDKQIEQMHRTVSYVKRHLAQRPAAEDIEHSRWAASLKNWGHDPNKH